MELSRRRLLMHTLFGGAGLLGLRSLATGIPISILANPRRALARERAGRAESPSPSAQYVILATSYEGDPLNANAPGSYVNAEVGHPTSPEMAPTRLALAGQTVTAARPWSRLPQAMLDRSCFFHHATYTVVHAEEPQVMALQGFVADHKMYAALLAEQLAPRLGTVQREPIVLGTRNSTEDLFFEGHPEPILSASSLAAILAPPSGPLGNLTQLRDADLDRLNALVKAEGNPAKSTFIDRYAQSRAQARSLSQDLLSVLASIQDDSADSQVKAAVTLIRMNVAPVISIHVPFGGDNHGDVGLFAETSQTISGVATLGGLWSQLSTANLQDRVSFLSLNVFGRTLLASTSADGRQHNANHHVAMMFGPAFHGSVVGGIERKDDDLGAMSIDPVTGAGVANGGGDIPFGETLQSMARTFGAGVGLSPSTLNENILGGQTVASALSPSA